MKDAAHHRKYTQKKVIQSIRKSAEEVPKNQQAATKGFQEKR